MDIHNSAGLKSLAVLLSAMLSLTGCAGNANSQQDTSEQAPASSTAESAPETPDSSEANSMTSLEVIRAMGNGINPVS